MTKYIVGYDGSLDVYEKPPREMHARHEWIWPGSRVAFKAKRGVLEEWSFKGERSRARVLPEDAELRWRYQDRAVLDAELALQRARKERQELLLAAAQRGERVRVKADT